MKNVLTSLVRKYGHVAAGFAAMVVVTMQATACMSILHQPKMPSNAKNFKRK